MCLTFLQNKVKSLIVLLFCKLTCCSVHNDVSYASRKVILMDVTISFQMRGILFCSSTVVWENKNICYCHGYAEDSSVYELLVYQGVYIIY